MERHSILLSEAHSLSGVKTSVGSNSLNENALSAINELQLGGTISAAVQQHRRADFALLMALFSDDVRDTTPLDITPASPVLDEQLRSKFGVSNNRPLRSNQESYPKGAAIAQHFHEGGLQSAKLQDGLSPDALAYLPENTFDLAEETFNNLSIHSRRTLTKNHTLDKSQPAVTRSNDLASANGLYQSLISNKIESRINAYS